MIKTVTFEDELKKDYINYAMSVIISRAIPDVRDGLKPVQRRILYTMYELGLKYNKPYKKSATIVGNCIARYHPHGDQPVYEALVRMAQDFNMRYPLIEGHGNFGSIDGDPPAAMRYCVTGDCLVLTDKGLIKIEEIIESNDNEEKPIYIKILSFDKKENVADKFFNSGIHKTIKIKTEIGLELEGSLNHPVLCLSVDRNGKPIFKWKTLSDINIGDYIVVERFSKYFPKKDLINNEEAILLGILCCKGRLSADGFYITLDKNFSKTFEEIFVKIYGSRFKRYEKDKDVVYKINDAEILKDLENKGLIIDHRDREIPYTILRSSESIQISFLKTLFNLNSNIDKNRFIFHYHENEKFLKQLQIMLLNHGIVSKLEDNRLSIEETLSLKILIERIGIDLKDFKNQTNNYEKIPFLAKYLVKKYNLNGLFNKDLNYYNVEKHKDLLYKILDDEDKKFLDLLLRNKYLFVKVVEKKITGMKRVYSIRVKSCCHSFIANGVINHNTEARLSKISEEMLDYLNKETVNFVPNFDGTLKEPEVLPSKIPNLLINGSTGIAVGFSTNIPPHNIKEVCEALIYMLENPDAKIDEILKIIKGPDFPTGGVIVDVKKLHETYKKGRGIIKIRGKVILKDRLIIIKEIPYQVNKSKLVQEIAELVKNKVIDGVLSIRDESDREGIRICIYLRKNTDAKALLNILYEKTSLETSFNVINLVLVNGRPKILNIKDILKEYLKFRIEIERKRLEYDLKKEYERKNKLEMLLFAVEKSDEILKILKETKSKEELYNILMKKYNLRNDQIKILLELKLSNLTGFEKDRYEKEYKECLKKIKEYESILKDENKLKKLVREDLERIIKEYGDERRTEILEEYDKRRFYIRLDTRSLTISRSFDKPGIEVTEDDKILLLLDDGRVYILKPEKIPTKETKIENLFKIKDSKILLIDILPKKNKKLIIITEKGYVKKFDLALIEKSGRKLIRGSERIIFAGLCKGKKKIKISCNKFKMEIPIDNINLHDFNERGEKIIPENLIEKCKNLSIALI